MPKIEIVGNRRLSGEISVGGAKNSAVALIHASNPSLSAIWTRYTGVFKWLAQWTTLLSASASTNSGLLM